jgi:hypothetical protein
LLRDVVEDDDGVGDIVVVLVALVREEEEEEDGLEFSIFHTQQTHAAPHSNSQNGREKCISSSFSRSLSVDRD